ncbi:hypothetical protein Trydic_g8020 [Trypoxylus dichotomus]
MLKTPDKPAEQFGFYRPISLVPVMSKLFDKLLLKRLKPLINIPDYKFGFRNRHSTIKQVHRVTALIKNAFEEKKYCPAIFLDVSHIFDRVGHSELIDKMRKQVPQNYCQQRELYISERKFRVISAGVLQGSILGPLLYLLYTVNIPTTKETVLRTFADDTVICHFGKRNNLQQSNNETTSCSQQNLSMSALRCGEKIVTLLYLLGMYSSSSRIIEIPRHPSW